MQPQQDTNPSACSIYTSQCYKPNCSTSLWTRLCKSRLEFSIFIGNWISVLILVFAGTRNNLDPSIKSSDSENKSWLFPNFHVAVVLVSCTVISAFGWFCTLWCFRHQIAKGYLVQQNARINLQMAWIYAALGFFLFSAELFGLAPNIRYWNILPYTLIVVVVLQTEKIFCRHDSDWGFTLCAVPICFLSFCAREAHLMIAGFCFSAMEFVYNAPPRFDTAVDHILLFGFLYFMTVCGMQQFYGQVESPMDPSLDWRVEFCFLTFIVPFRAPILYKRLCDSAFKKSKSQASAASATSTVECKPHSTDQLVAPGILPGLQSGSVAPPFNMQELQKEASMVLTLLNEVQEQKSALHGEDLSVATQSLRNWVQEQATIQM